MYKRQFKTCDEVLLQGVQGITDLITTPGLINTDFADVKMIMNNAGSALMGIGHASGEGEERGPDLFGDVDDDEDIEGDDEFDVPSFLK